MKQVGKKKRRLSWLFIVLPLVVVALAAGGWYYFGQRAAAIRVVAGPEPAWVRDFEMHLFPGSADRQRTGVRVHYRKIRPGRFALAHQFHQSDPRAANANNLDGQGPVGCCHHRFVVCACDHRRGRERYRHRKSWLRVFLKLFAQDDLSPLLRC